MLIVGQRIKKENLLKLQLKLTTTAIAAFSYNVCADYSANSF